MMASYYITMYKLLLGVAVFGFVSSAPTLKSAENVRIVGGEDVEISEAPYQASILYLGRHSCGGAIISKNIIVTAAHCMMAPNPSDYEVRVGSSSNTRGGDVYSVGDFVSHPGFSYKGMDSDIALIWLSRPIVFNENASSIDLMESGKELEDGDMAIVTGWGNTVEGGGNPKILQKTQVPKVNERDCYHAYSPDYTITSRMLCAGYPEGGKDACQGDSGGPLVHGNKLVGVVSWGLGCARPQYPGVYAKISALRTWLDEHIAYLRLKHVLRAFH
ncbi:vitellin-degrading protease-like [Galleria mellonella]|uniref:Vitellin-degrading protease-like n=1 Tax=Galleria mellonella TaxID=7137 RepID=A0ABM3MI23_GALME|nr:vitellin-degrading protease-like [Galleria mellonella]